MLLKPHLDDLLGTQDDEIISLFFASSDLWVISQLMNFGMQEEDCP